MADDEALLQNVIRLHHMLDAAREAVNFADGQTLQMLEADRMRTLALTRCIEIIGEAAASVTTDFRQEHTSLPWRVIVATRNRLIHAYFDVDLAVLLDTTHHDLPILIAALEAIVEAHPEVGLR